MNNPGTGPWLHEAVQRRAQEFASQMRSIADGSTPVPGLEWSVAELGQHVACLPSFWQSQHDEGQGFERPADFAAYTAAAAAEITETDLNLLADRCEHEFVIFGERQKSNAQQWLYGVEMPARNMCGMALNELILHGRDLAAVSGAALPTYDPREANAAVDGICTTMPFFVDETRAQAQPDGVYHVHFRGGRDYTWTKQGERLLVTDGRPKRADARLSTDPAMFLLSSLGRVSQLRAGLSGKMVAYGKRPWRFVGLGTIAIDDV